MVMVMVTGGAEDTATILSAGAADVRLDGTAITARRVTGKRVGAKPRDAQSPAAQSDSCAQSNPLWSHGLRVLYVPKFANGARVRSG